MAALTANTVPKATDGTHIANSLLTEDATTLAYNTNKFTVTAASGNTLIAGTTSFTGKVFPTSDDGAALGDTTHNFSDLFLATGALINFANSNAVITHSSGILTVSTGDLRVTTAGTTATSVVTLNGTQTLANKTLTTPVIGAATGTSLSLTGNVSTGVGSGAAGTVVLTEGTAPSLTANAFSIYAPADVAAGGLAYITPAAAATGFILATNVAGVMTLSHVASTGTGSVVLGTAPTVTSPQISLTAAHGSDDTYSGTTIAGLNSGATVAQWETVYLGSSSTWLLADANGSSTYPAQGMAVAAYVNTDPAIILVMGTVRNDAFNFTPGGLLYLSGTPGAITQTAPSTSGDKVQIIGFALTADIIYVKFDNTYLTVT